jgi:hypothetical protein
MFKSRDKNKNQPQLRAPNPSSHPANVFSYYSSRSRTDSSTGRREDPARIARSRWRYAPSVIAGLVIFFCVIYVITLRDDPRVMTFSGSQPNVLRDVQVYEDAGSRIMKSSLFNRSKLTINTKEIENTLKTEFPELETVSVNLPLVSRRPVIQVAPAKPSIILTNGSEAYIISETGRALLRTNEVDALHELRLPQVIDDVGIDITAGETVLPVNTIDFIRDLYVQFSEKDIPIQTTNLPAVANEVHIKPRNQPYTVKFNLQEDVRLQFGSFVAVVESLRSQGATPREYVDVRVEGRAYYR